MEGRPENQEVNDVVRLQIPVMIRTLRAGKGHIKMVIK
jgi:hypothetical protein